MKERLTPQVLVSRATIILTFMHLIEVKGFLLARLP